MAHKHNYNIIRKTASVGMTTMMMNQPLYCECGAKQEGMQYSDGIALFSEKHPQRAPLLARIKWFFIRPRFKKSNLEK